MTDDPLARLRDAVRRTAELTRARPASGTTHNDADDTVGTVATDSARDFDPFPLLAAAHRAGVKLVVIGQVAGIMHGSAELTGDLDLLWDGDPGRAAGLAAALAEVGGVIEEEDGGTTAPDAAVLARRKCDFRTPAASGDLCTPALPWGDLDVAAFLDRALTASDGAGLTVHYLRREDLVAMRRAVGRPKDLRRAAELEALGRARDA